MQWLLLFVAVCATWSAGLGRRLGSWWASRRPGGFALMPGVPAAFLPRRKTTGSAGYDLVAYLPEPHASLVLQPGRCVKVRTGVRLRLGPGWHALVYDRSSFRARMISTLGVGVIDEDYQDELCVILANLGDQPQVVAHGDAIAQLTFARTHTVGDKVAAVRTGGFGSTDQRPQPPTTWPAPPALRLGAPEPHPAIGERGPRETMPATRGDRIARSTRIT